MLNSQHLIYLISLGFLQGMQPAMAQSTTSRPTPTNRSQPQQIIFQPPPNQGRPKSTSSAGSRRDWQCPQDATSTTLTNQTPMMTLTPADSNYGLTTAGHPTFLVYLPQTSAKQVLLTLETEDHQFHSQTFIPIKGKAAIVSIKAGDNSPPLEVGKSYQWALVLVCGDKPSPNDPVITSNVRRITFSQPQNHQRTALEQADIYSQQGIWYDAVLALAKVKNTHPGNPAIANIWTNFLKSVGLEAIATQPLHL